MASGPDHRHVARVVDHPVFLFEGGFMFFIDHDQPQILERQEQGGARADHDFGIAQGGGPGPTPR